MKLLAVALSLTLVACDSGSETPPPEPGESLADYIAKYGADAKARVQAVRALEGGIASARFDGPPPDDIEILLDGGSQLSSANAIMLYDDELGGEATKHYAALPTGAGMSYCNHFAKLADENSPDFAKAAAGTTKTFYEVCGRMKYAVVIRVRTEQKPVLGDLDESTNTQVFNPGRVDADVLVFSMPGGKVVGGVAVTATNSESATADKGTDILEDDLRYNLYQAIRPNIPIPETATKSYLQ